MLNVKHILHRVRNKIWRLYNHTLPEFMSMLQFLWLLHIGSKPMKVNQKSAMVIAPHQDDEVLGCGGLIKLKREQNVPVQIVFVTDGAASHGKHPKFQSGEMVSIRKQEALSALSILGIDSEQIYFLDKPDSQLQYLDASKRQQTIEQLAQLLKSFQPGEVYVTHRQDRIKDHEVTYELLLAAIQYSEIEVDILQYPIWILWKSLLFRDLKLDELASAYRISIHSVQNKKIEALGAYRSQCLPIDAETYAVLKPGFLRRFFVPYEIFFKPSSLLSNQ
ncbi:PIG-L deacetylase family protein [Nostoc sp. TCL240-02]|uniref:PIG-L deacetylase family protein n=1 Tax=Nostoc sp. TCL240-02 TaxID=2572090 RepID=UPI00157F9821|nr:PIG-L family deacetylase [Nostoc sp. TCL240-02]QKQ73652.1 PIG-L family deacetylase [Nostoc sp. TCL240-02]